MKKLILAALAAITLAAAPARASSSPRGYLDQCQGKPLAIHLSGWAYDPDAQSQPVTIWALFYMDAACSTLYPDYPRLTADLSRPDVNQALGIAGDHGFDATIPIAWPGTYWVQLYAIDVAGDDDFVQIGSLRSVTVTEPPPPGMVRLWEGGPYWAEANIGAAEPWDYGWHFWWGDTVGYICGNDACVASDGSSFNFSFEAGNVPTAGVDTDTLLREGWITADGNLAPAHDAAQAHWGGAWRMPTYQEMRSLFDNCDRTWTTTNGVSGVVLRGRGEYASASIFLPAAGRIVNTSVSYPNEALFWTSSHNVTALSEGLSQYIAFDGTLFIAKAYRYYGHSIRPVATGSVAISFDVNGGYGVPTSERYMPGMAYGPLPSATRDGYTFAGWFTAADGGTQVTAASTVPASAATLHAHWTGNQYTVTFVRGGTGGTESVTATYGSPMPAIAVPTRPGCVFDGYVDGGGVRYYTASGESARNWDKADATTLYSQWTLIQYAVTLDGQGGTGGTERVTAEYDYPMPTIAVPTRPGYEFRGYYTGADGAGTKYYKASGKSVRSWDLTDDATLYAKWTVSGEYGKVQLWEGGPYWAERNVGADESWESGLYFWWGDTVGYERENDAWAASDGSTSNFSFEEGNALTEGKYGDTLQSEGWITDDDSDSVLTPSHDAARAHWGGDWRMPTYYELAQLRDSCDWTWTTTNGVSGYIVRGRGEYSAASIFLPAAGQGTRVYWDNGSSGNGYYWASSLEYYSLGGADCLGFSSGSGTSIYSYRRYYGNSVRPVQSAPTAYDIWASANGVTGAWDATDANGVHNVFRYAFDKPAGAFTNPPLLSIHFENGEPVVLTPPLVNTNGYTFGILAYDALTNANPSAFWLLSPDGTNAVPGNLPARFFRLGAEEGNIVEEGNPDEK